MTGQLPVCLPDQRLLTALNGVEVGLVQSQYIGDDGVASVLPDGCLFATAARVHETSTAELEWGMMISSQRGMPDFVRNQETGTWDKQPAPEPRGPPGTAGHAYAKKC